MCLSVIDVLVHRIARTIYLEDASWTRYKFDSSPTLLATKNARRVPWWGWGEKSLLCDPGSYH